MCLSYIDLKSDKNPKPDRVKPKTRLWKKTKTRPDPDCLNPSRSRTRLFETHYITIGGWHFRKMMNSWVHSSFCRVAWLKLGRMGQNERALKENSWQNQSTVVHHRMETYWMETIPCLETFFFVFSKLFFLITKMIYISTSHPNFKLNSDLKSQLDWIKHN